LFLSHFKVVAHFSVCVMYPCRACLVGVGSISIASGFFLY
jgi:hypothetical protein